MQRLGMLIKSKHSYSVTFICTYILRALHSVFFSHAPLLYYRLSDPLQYQSIVDAEWNIIYDKLDKCVKSGAKIVLSRLAIGDLATQVCTIVCSLFLFCSNLHTFSAAALAQ
jgi:hypothetical protein